MSALFFVVSRPFLEAKLPNFCRHRMSAGDNSADIECLRFFCGLLAVFLEAKHPNFCRHRMSAGDDSADIECLRNSFPQMYCIQPYFTVVKLNTSCRSSASLGARHYVS
jgi:hypothetical protein